MPKLYPASSLIDAFRFALQGLLRTLEEERNMKIHWLCGMAVLMVSMALPLPFESRVALLLSMGLVLAFELMNAAIEAIVDLLVTDFDARAQVAKDAAAGAVLVFAAASASVLCTVLYGQWPLVTQSQPAILRTILLGVPCLVFLGLGLFVQTYEALSFGLSIALAAPLAYQSQDPISSGLTIVLLLIGTQSKLRLGTRKVPPIQRSALDRSELEKPFHTPLKKPFEAGPAPSASSPRSPP